MRLSELKTGEKGVIVKVLGHGGFRKRIVEMGFIKGKTVEVLLNAPLKDPVKYKVMGYEISLRRQEADMIEVISEQEALEQVFPDYHDKGLVEDVQLVEDEMRSLARDKRRTINVALVGNPNCGTCRARIHFPPIRPKKFTSAATSSTRRRTSSSTWSTPPTWSATST